MAAPVDGAPRPTEVLRKLEAPALKGLLPDFLAAQVEGGDRERVASFVAHWTDADYVELLERLRVLGEDHRVYEAVPSCRALARRFVGEECINREGSSVEGAEHLEAAMAAGRTVIVTNHLSYLDATGTDALLAAFGLARPADAITYLAGPKVYQELFRLVAAASIHTLPVPQSAAVSTEPLSAREVARRAVTAMQSARGALDAGKTLLFYPEGSRTRSGRLEPFLKGTHRYLRSAEFLVPAAIDGTDRVMPLDGRRLVPGPVRLSFAPAIALHDGDADDDEARSRANGRDALVRAHEAIAARLPPEKRPSPGVPALH